MPRVVVTLLLLLLGAFFGAASSAAASSDLPKIRPYFADAVSDAAELRRWLGDSHYYLESCPGPGARGAPDNRRLRVSLQQLPEGGFEANRDLANGALQAAAEYVWTNCPRSHDGASQAEGASRYDIKSIAFYDPPGRSLLSARLRASHIGARAPPDSTPEYVWTDVEDHEVKARLAAGLPPPHIAAIERKRAEEEQAVATRLERRKRTQESESFAFALILTALLIGGVLAFLFYLSRDSMVELYYTITPHPAASTVRNAIDLGAEIDGSLYREVVEMPLDDDNPIGQRVRSRQATELTRGLRAHEAAIRGEERRRMEAERARVEKEIALLRSHAELLKSGIDHEIAAARLAEVKKLTER